MLHQLLTKNGSTCSQLKDLFEVFQLGIASSMEPIQCQPIGLKFYIIIFKVKVSSFLSYVFSWAANIVSIFIPHFSDLNALAFSFRHVPLFPFWSLLLPYAKQKDHAFLDRLMSSSPININNLLWKPGKSAMILFIFKYFILKFISLTILSKNFCPVTALSLQYTPPGPGRPHCNPSYWF